MTQKRVTIRLSEDNERKLVEVAESYGMSVSSLGAYIIGQWLHTNYKLKDRVIETLGKELIDRLKEDPNAQEEFAQFAKWLTSKQ
jgi:hypothetical protein